MLNWQDALTGMYFNTDWTDSPSTSVVSSSPEVGLPIRRLRSYNVKHALSCSMTLTYTQFRVFYNFVMRDLHGGMDQFKFRSFIDGAEYTACLVADGGKPFSYKRQDETLYSVSMTIAYIELGGAANA